MEEKAWAEREKPAGFPWRRYFARMTDVGLYSLVWTALCMLVFHIRGLETGFLENTVDVIVTMALMVAVEPLLLSVFGTTPGKWIFGICLRRKDGERITYRQAMARTWEVLWRGMGLDIPIYTLYRAFKSYQICKSGAELDWDLEWQATLRDRKAFRWALFAFSQLLTIAGIVLCTLFVQVPPNKGDLTVAEFAENYNYLTELLSVWDGGWQLNEEGSWEKTDMGDGVVVFSNLYEEMPKLQYQMEKGVLTGVSFSVERTDGEEIISNYENLMAVTALSYGAVRHGSGGFLSSMRPILTAMQEHYGESYRFSFRDVQISWEREVTGYLDTSHVYAADEDADRRYYRLDFSIE